MPPQGGTTDKEPFMSWFPETIQERLVLVLAHFIWQGLCVAGLLAVLVAVSRVKRPSVRYASSLMAFLLMSASPIVTWFVLPDAVSRSVPTAVESPQTHKFVTVPIVEPETPASPGPRLEPYDASTPERLAVDFRIVEPPAPPPVAELPRPAVTDWRQSLRAIELAEAERNVARAEFEDESLDKPSQKVLELRLQAAKSRAQSQPLNTKIKKTEFDRLSEANRKVPGAVSAYDLGRGKLDYEIALLQEAKVKNDVITIQDQLDGKPIDGHIQKSFELQREIAQAELRFAQSEFEKVLEANRKVPGAISNTEIERARLKVVKAQLALEQLALGAGLPTPPEKPTEGLPNNAPPAKPKSTDPNDENSGPNERQGQETRANDGRGHFAFVGTFDLDGDGQSDRERLRQLVTDARGVIDVEVDDDGQRIPRDGKLTEATTFLVIGDIPDLKQAKDDADKAQIERVQEQLRTLRDEARKCEVRVVKLNDFLSWGSHINVSRVGNFDLRAPVKPVARGVVQWIAPERQVVWIGLGAADGIKSRMKFQVFEKGTGEKRDPPPAVKGKIEVSRIIDRHTSEARILEEQPNIALKKGDEIVLVDEAARPDERPDGTAKSKSAEARSAESQKAIEQGIAFLKAQQQENGTWLGQPADGVTALCAAALLQAGVKADDPVMQKALAHLRKVEPTLSYTVALQTMVFCWASPKEDAELIQRNVEWLEKAQVAEGKSRGAWSYAVTNGGRGDGSCSRFGVLGLDAAKRAGFKVNDETWKRVSDYWLTAQKENGAWGYTPESGPTLTMTLAGVAGLATANRHLPNDDQTKTREAAMRKPTDYLEKSIPDWPRSGFAFYALHCLERAGHLSSLKEFGKLDWKADATKRLLESQNPNGSWKGNNQSESELIATSFALMCLTGKPEPPRERQVRIEPRDKDQPIQIYSQRIDDSVPPHQRTVITGGVRIEFIERDEAKWRIEADRVAIESEKGIDEKFEFNSSSRVRRIECIGSVKCDGGVTKLASESLWLDLTQQELRPELPLEEKVRNLPPK
jgi:hypothetical protein